MSISEKSLISAIETHNTGSSDPGLSSILKLETPVSELSTQFEESGPFFQYFIELKILPEGFALKPQEEILIQNLFKKWALGNRICLIDLLGVEIYDRINEALPNKDSKLIKEFQNHFLAFFAAFNLHFIREIPTETPSEILDQFYGSRDQIIKEFNSLKTNIKRQINIRKDEILNSPSKISTATRNHLVAALEKKSVEIGQYIDLVISLFQLPEAGKILRERSLELFPGSTALQKKEEETLKHLQKYIHYMRDLFVACQKRGCISFDASAFIEPIMQFVTDHLKNPRLKTASEFQKQILNSPIERQKKYCQQLLIRAENGDLTHKKWVEENKVTLRKEKTQREFIELLVQQLCVTLLVQSFIRDIENIVDNEIFENRFPGNFIPYKKRKERIILNASLIANQTPPPVLEESSSPMNPLLRAIREECTTLFKPLLEEVQQIGFVRNLSGIQITTQIEPNEPCLTAEDQSPVDQTVIESFRACIESLKRLNHLLPSSQSRLIENLQKIVENNPQMGSRTLEEIKALLFSEMNGYFPLIILLKDIETLEEATPIISEELADFLELEGLTIPEIVPVSQSIISPPPSLATKDAPTENINQPLSPKIPAFEKKEKEVSVKGPSLKEEEEETFKLESTNVRKIITQLAKLGFIDVSRRRKGSHRVYKLQDPSTKQPSGPQVIVPVHAGSQALPIGTAKSIQNMVLEAIGSQKAKK